MKSAALVVSLLALGCAAEKGVESPADRPDEQTANAAEQAMVGVMAEDPGPALHQTAVGVPVALPPRSLETDLPAVPPLRDRDARVGGGDVHGAGGRHGGRAE
jgi:hypothetical protein